MRETHFIERWSTVHKLNKMEKISDFELFLKCRLCGVNGLHEMDILEIDASSGPDIANALSEKIFRCVGIRVRIHECHFSMKMEN